jgi:hypothetical protein
MSGGIDFATLSLIDNDDGAAVSADSSAFAGPKHLEFAFGRRLSSTAGPAANN